MYIHRLHRLILKELQREKMIEGKRECVCVGRKEE